jgi:hypothetical protein
MIETWPEHSNCLVFGCGIAAGDSILMVDQRYVVRGYDSLAELNKDANDWSAKGYDLHSLNITLLTHTTELEAKRDVNCFHYHVIFQKVMFNR